jgi:hypothetical protein
LQDYKIRFRLQVESHISNWLFSESRLLASYVSRHKAMAYDTIPLSSMLLSVAQSMTQWKWTYLLHPPEYWHLLGTRSGMHLSSTTQSQVAFTLFLYNSSSSSELERMNLVGFPKRFLGCEVSVKHSLLLSLLLLSVLGYFCPRQCIHLQNKKQIGESSIAGFGHLKILCQLVSQRLTNWNSLSSLRHNLWHHLTINKISSFGIDESKNTCLVYFIQ